MGALRACEYWYEVRNRSCFSMIGSHECVYEKYTSMRFHVSEGSSSILLIVGNCVPLLFIDGLKMDSKLSVMSIGMLFSKFGNIGDSP